MTPRKLLVIGATGQQGGAVIANILAEKTLAAKFSIYGLTRNISSPSSVKLTQRNVTMISGDVTVPTPIFEKIGKDVWGVFSMTNRGKGEEQEAKPLIDAAIANGVKHFVFGSVDRGGPSKSDTDPTYVPHFITKFNVEKYLIEKAAKSKTHMSWTILRLVAFMENLDPGMMEKSMARIMAQMGSVRLQLVSTKDIGKIAARVFSRPEDFAGKALTLAGDSLNYEELNKIFKEEVGMDVPTAPSLMVSIFNYFNDDIGKMAKWLREGGYAGPLDAAVKEEFGMMDFRTWLKTASKWETTS